MHLKIAVQESQARGEVGAPGLPALGAAVAVWWSKRGPASQPITEKGATEGQGGSTQPQRELLLIRIPATVRTHWLLILAMSFLPSVHLCHFTGTKSSFGLAFGPLPLPEAVITAIWAEEHWEAAGILSPRGRMPNQKRGMCLCTRFIIAMNDVSLRMTCQIRVDIF